MVLSLVPYIGVICFGIQFCYPAYESVLTLTKESPKQRDLIQWTTYWILVVGFMFLESTLLSFVLDFIPLYLEIKALVFLWLAHPDFLGAAWLWQAKLSPLWSRRGEELYAKVMGAFGKVLPMPSPSEHAEVAPPTPSAPVASTPDVASISEMGTKTISTSVVTEGRNEIEEKEEIAEEPPTTTGVDDDSNTVFNNEVAEQ